ncbi:HEAT repeat domain-containing protein [Mycoavidus sp. HKI]|uniref:HEAT repeat domain-containing protein n=1 Tax=Mycoavidus sp. HKI TaxID=2840467 RepID=UPI001CBEDACF|nr:HEAT repeat domain-containing protein [Mycoavidus sp. HKI]UAW64845.1 HEAT repeat domain-containing protein [Mycoavidus sp. HKI]
MLNFIAGVRPSSPAPSSRHLAISSQHLLSQAHAHKAVGNLDAAQKSYRDAIEKAKIEHEENPGNSQAKKNFDAISKEFLAFLNELSLSGHQEPGTVAPLEEQTFLSPNRLLPINRNDATTHGLRSAQRLQDTFLSNSVRPVSMSQQPVFLPAQAKSELVDYLFTKALSTLGSLEVPDKPSLFLVYAHDNPAHGKAEADTSKYFIDKLSRIRGVKLHSDQAPMGQPYSNSPEELKEDSKLEDILTNQLCLLPDQLIKEVKPVDKVVVCCSEVLGSYLKWSDYKKFHQELRDAYHEDRETYHKDAEQPRTLAIREVVRKFSQEQAYKAGFHHVLTEIAFLQIRAEYKDQHGIIPVSLTENSYAQCLAHFIPATTVRMEDIPQFEQKTKVGREVHPNQSRHWVLFKVIERLLVASDEAQTFLNKFWEAYIKFVSEPSTLDRLEFVKLVDSIFEEIQAALHGQLARDLPQMRKLHTEIKQKLLTPNLSSIDVCEALYKHYQRSNLSIQWVSGQTVSLDDCYINLAIVESQAQREKDKKELRKQAATFERLPSSERQRLEATNSNKLIALEKLFEKQKLRDGLEGIPKRILIQGRAGIGKTTLCKKLVYEYHQNGLWQDQFESVLWVPLRQLKTHAPKRLEDLLCTQYLVDHESSEAQALSKVFYAHRDKTLFILDGLDEVVGELNEGRPLKNFLQTLLTQAHVVITSRPAGVDAKLLGQLDLELETVGFSSDNVQAYIEKCVPASNQAAIQQFIHRTPLIQGLVNIPIQLDALCYSWDRLPQNQEMTMSMLYEAMVDKLWRKDSVRLEKEEEGKVLGVDVIEDLSESDLEELMTAEIHYLGYLAFKGLETEKIEFSREELSQRRKELNERPQTRRKLPLNFTTNLKKTSYLHTADVDRSESERHYHFLHLTFQEFFAAKFLVEHLQAYAKVESASLLSHVVQKGLGAMLSWNELEAFIATHKYNPRYEIVWWMVAGLLKGVALENFFNVLDQSPRDLIGIRHQQVMMGCLNEARPELKGRLEIVETLETKLKQYFELEIKLIGQSQLGRQRFFPEHLLITNLNSYKDEIIKILRARPNLSANAIQAMIEIALKDRSWEVRKTVARILDEQKTLSANVLHALIGALTDQDKDVRYAAASALGGQSTLSEAAVRALSGALKDPDKDVRSLAARTLEEQKTLSEVAVLALVGALKDQDKDVRLSAVRTLEEQKTLSEAAVLALIDALKDQDKDVRSEAVHALEKQSTLSEAAVHDLIGALKNQDKDVGSAAASALGGQSMLSEAAVLALIGALKDQYKDVRSAAASALGGQSMLSEAAVRALIGALKDQDKDVRSAADCALGGRSTLSEAAVHDLIGALKDPDKEVRYAAARALGGQSTLSEAAVHDLIGALKDPDKEVRYVAAYALRGQSTLSKAAVQALTSALKDPGKDVRYVAACILGGRSTLSEAVVRALITDPDRDVRSAVARVLGGQSTLSEAAVRALSGALKGQDKDVRSAAAHVLGGQSTLSEAAVQALIGALKDPDKDVRYAAARALGGQSTLSEAAVQALIGALKDQDKDVRSATASALGGQSTLSEAAVQALIGALKDEEWDVKSATASALGGQSTLSEAAVHDLIGALKDQDKDVRSVAARALKEQKSLPADAILALITMLGGEDKSIKEIAIKILIGQETLSNNAIEVLITRLKDRDKSVRDAVVGILDLRIDQIYPMFASLAFEQIQTLYAHFLFPRSGKQVMFLYIQGNKLYFHTKGGLNHIELASPKIVIEAFKAVRENPEIIHVQESISVNTVAFSEEITNDLDINWMPGSNNPPQSKSRPDDLPILDPMALIDDAIARNIIQGHVSDSDEFIDDDSFWEGESESEVFSEEEEFAENED